MVVETGPWKAGRDEEAIIATHRCFVESADTTHLARLYVSGDFADENAQFAYAEEIAERLNRWGRLPQVLQQ